VSFAAYNAILDLWSFYVITFAWDDYGRIK
jgi:hypothetical protein